ncbi:Hypothetical protein EIN_077380, partial [Entamoeba invadens IP1]
FIRFYLFKQTCFTTTLTKYLPQVFFEGSPPLSHCLCVPMSPSFILRTLDANVVPFSNGAFIEIRAKEDIESV